MSVLSSLLVERCILFYGPEVNRLKIHAQNRGTFKNGEKLLSRKIFELSDIILKFGNVSNLLEKEHDARDKSIIIYFFELMKISRS